jgi:hypothetical protein
MKQVPAAAVPILPALGEEGFEIQKVMWASMLPAACLGSLELEPIRHTATLIAGPPGDLAVRQALFAQGMELLEYFLARLPMREAGATAVYRSVDNCVLRQDRPAGGTVGKVHLFFDRRAKILDR